MCWKNEILLFEYALIAGIHCLILWKVWMRDAVLNFLRSAGWMDAIATPVAGDLSARAQGGDALLGPPNPRSHIYVKKYLVHSQEIHSVVVVYVPLLYF